MKQIKTANGLRQKILYGFIILGCLLFFSGAVSFFELLRLTHNTKSIMDTNRTDIELSKKMLDAVQEQNTALLKIVGGYVVNADSIVMRSVNEFNEAFDEAYALHKSTDRLMDVELAKIRYNETVNQIFVDSIRNENIEWFAEVYSNSYYELTLAIKNFMLSTQNVVDENTERLRNNAYRAITPGILTLGIAIIIIIVFYGLIDLYYIKPVIKITAGLRDFLHSKIPFNVKVEGKDEVLRLKEYIDELVGMVKKSNLPEK